MLTNALRALVRALVYELFLETFYLENNKITINVVDMFLYFS